MEWGEKERLNPPENSSPPAASPQSEKQSERIETHFPIFEIVLNNLFIVF